MQYSKLSATELLSQTKIAAQNEKSATLLLLECLVEVDRRKLYAEKAYGTLFDYVMNELGYSETQTADRVNTVRLMQAVPAVKVHLQAGELSLTSASQIQRFIRAESKAVQGVGGNYSKAVPQTIKESVIQACLNQSKREVEKILLSHMSEPARVILEERVRAVTEQRTELKFTIDSTVLKKIEHIRNLKGHESLESVFEQALDALIAKEEKKKGFSDSLKGGGGNHSGNDSSQLIDPRSIGNNMWIKKSTLPAKWAGETVKSNPTSRYVPMNWKRAIYARSNGQCEFVDPKFKQRCKTRFLLQIDHRVPLALGGKTELNNLRHLCMQHNQKAAMDQGINVGPRKESMNPEINY